MFGIKREPIEKRMAKAAAELTFTFFEFANNLTTRTFLELQSILICMYAEQHGYDADTLAQMLENKVRERKEDKAQEG